MSSPSPGEGSTTPVTTSTPAPPTPAAGTETADEHIADHNSGAEHPAPSTPAPTHPGARGRHTRAPPVVEAPAVVVQRKQKTTPSKQGEPQPHGDARAAVEPALPASGAKGPTTASGPNGVAPSPQLVAAQAGALAAELATSAASAQALGFYRIPLFLLPIYRAAAIQYGVPWQILAAINEVETDYGSDLSVSSAGAEGLDAVRAVDLAAVRRGRAGRRLRRPLQPGGRDLRRRPLSARGRRREEPAHGDPRLQPLRSLCRARCCCARN